MYPLSAGNVQTYKVCTSLSAGNVLTYKVYTSCLLDMYRLAKYTVESL